MNEQNQLLVTRYDIFCGLTHGENCASAFPSLGLHILPEDLIKVTRLQKSCLRHWANNWGWLEAWPAALLQRLCSIVEEDTGRFKLQWCFWVCPFSILPFLHPRSPLCACHHVKYASEELVFMLSWSSNHPKPSPSLSSIAQFLGEVEHYKWSINKDQNQGGISQERTCFSCAGVSTETFVVWDIFLGTCCRVKADTSQYWCWISTNFASESSSEFPVGAVW